MIPPIAAINDSLDLLKTIADPERAAKVLEELQTHAANAAQMIAGAQAAQRDANDKAAALAHLAAQLDQRQNEINQRVIDEEARMKREDEARVKMHSQLTAAQAELVEQQRQVARDAADLRRDRQEHNRRKDALDKLAAKIAIDKKALDELAATLRPVIEKVRGKAYTLEAETGQLGVDMGG